MSVACVSPVEEVKYGVKKSQPAVIVCREGGVVGGGGSGEGRAWSPCCCCVGVSCVAGAPPALLYSEVLVVLGNASTAVAVVR